MSKVPFQTCPCEAFSSAPFLREAGQTSGSLSNALGFMYLTSGRARIRWGRAVPTLLCLTDPRKCLEFSPVPHPLVSGMSREALPKIRSPNQCPESTLNPNRGAVEGSRGRAGPAGLLVRAPRHGNHPAARWQEAQDAPRVTFKGRSLHVGAKLNCSGAASRPGLLAFISPGSSPIPIPLPLRRSQNRPSLPSPHLGSFN